MEIYARICFLYCPTTLKAWQALYLRHICGCTFRYRFFTFVRNPWNTHKSKKSSLLAHFWEPFGSLRGTFGRLFVTKVPQRFQKVVQKRPNGSKAPQKGSKKTKRSAFLEKFDVFSTISLFSLLYWLLFGSYWRLLAPIGSSWLLLLSICSYCFLLSPIASSLFLLSPIGS